MARGKGEGSITEVKMKNGKTQYQARITSGYDENGKQKRQAKYFKTKREAKEWLTEVKAAQDKGNYVEPSKMAVGQWMDEWLETYKKRSVRESTCTTYYTWINQHIRPAFGEIKLKDLRTDMIQKFINGLCDNGYKKSYVKKILTCLHGALEQAVTNGLIIRNVATKITIPKLEKPERGVLTAEEQARLIDVAKHDFRYGHLFILMLATGLRIGEASALTWNDINFEEETLSVNKTVSSYHDYNAIGKKSRREIGPPKTESSNRIIPLIPSILEMLREKKQNAIYNEKNLLFPSIHGDFIPHETASKGLKALLEKASIENNIHPHSLRHSFATRGLENGIELRVMQELLGHSSIQVTADIYSHVLPRKKKDSIMKLEDSINI